MTPKARKNSLDGELVRHRAPAYRRTEKRSIERYGHTPMSRAGFE
jgi:hypothetical protein